MICLPSPTTLGYFAAATLQAPLQPLLLLSCLASSSGLPVDDISIAACIAIAAADTPSKSLPKACAQCCNKLQVVGPAVNFLAKLFTQYPPSQLHSGGLNFISFISLNL
jgi:hypothetical protein